MVQPTIHLGCIRYAQTCYTLPSIYQSSIYVCIHCLSVIYPIIYYILCFFFLLIYYLSVSYHLFSVYCLLSIYLSVYLSIIYLLSPLSYVFYYLLPTYQLVSNVYLSIRLSICLHYSYILFPGPWWTKQHKIKSSPGEADAIQRGCKHEMFEAAAGITSPMLYSNVFLPVKGTHSRITMVLEYTKHIKLVPWWLIVAFKYHGPYVLYSAAGRLIQASPQADECDACYVVTMAVSPGNRNPRAPLQSSGTTFISAFCRWQKCHYACMAVYQLGQSVRITPKYKGAPSSLS